MPTESRRLTLEEFLALPEEKPALERHPDGTISQKAWPNVRHSALQGGLATLIEGFASPRRLALVFIELLTVFGGAAYVPDLAVYIWERILWTSEGELPDDFTEAPDITGEIVAAGENATALVRKCLWYVENGVKLALLVDPKDRSVVVFRPNGLPRVLGGADPIDLSEVLPEFQASVEQLFSALKN